MQSMKPRTLSPPQFVDAMLVSSELIEGLVPDMPLQWIQHTPVEDGRLVVGGFPDTMKVPGLVTATFDSGMLQEFSYSPGKSFGLFPVIGLRMYSVDAEDPAHDPRTLSNKLRVFDTTAVHGLSSIVFSKAGICMVDASGAQYSGDELGVPEGISQKAGVDAMNRIRSGLSGRLGRWCDDQRYATIFQQGENRYMTIM